jgi:hypothetical protein
MTKVRWLVGGAVIVLAACGDRPPNVSSNEAPRGGAPSRQALTAATACAVSGPGRGWVTVPLPRQTGAFTWDFNARPVQTRTDSVVGLVNGTATAYTSLAAIVRFSPAGVIDVRRGNAYSADAFVPYAPGVDYHVRMAVDLTRHLYTVWITTPGQAPVRVAASYPFRTEQAGVTKLDGYAAFLDPDATGGVQACGSVIGPAQSLSASEPRCAYSAVGAAWVNRALDRQTGTFFYEFEATPWNYAIDAVVGVSSGPASGYDSLAAITRFAPTGLIDARRGGGYANDLALQYTPGIAYRVSMAVDLASHRYSMWAGPVGGPRPFRIASNYAFRTSQAAVSALDNAGQFVDPGSSGSLTVCAPQAERTGQPLWSSVVEEFGQVIMAQGGKLLLASRPGSTVVLDPATGQVVRRVGVGGLIAAAGSVYYVLDVFAETGIGDDRRPYVAQFDSDWNLRWAQPFTGSGAGALAASPTRGVAVASLNDGITFYDSNGQQQWVRGPGAADVAFDPDDYLHVITNNDPSIQVSLRDVFGGVVWTRTYTSDSVLSGRAITVDADGDTVFGGSLFGTADFGGGPITVRSQEPGQVGYLVRLDRSGQHLYSQALYQVHAVTMLAADWIGNVAVGGPPQDAPTIQHGKVDSTGKVLWWHSGDETGIGTGLGFSRSLATDSFGRSYLLVEPNGDDLGPHIAGYAP